MYCKHCGSKVADNSNFCTSCGGALGSTETAVRAVTEEAAQSSDKPAEKKNDALAIAGFAISLVSFLGAVFLIPPAPIVGIVLSVLGLRRIKRSGNEGRGLAIAGIILGALALLLLMLASTIMAILFALLGTDLLAVMFG
ncbi:MAG: DUF4190 domain-containing protein [Clostridia bacterium]|nr:DUF4190 domain-containing protein [Clostridia bacterium]